MVDPDRSVTCPFCGGLADERETISLWVHAYDGPMRERVADLPDGEAHPDCFDRAVNGGDDA